jgi:glucose-1-phosphate cytidylyltransferase
MAEPTAILLCGGKGQRLRPFTETLPKALVPLNGRPLLEHLLRYLAAWGVRRFVVCVGYLAEQVESFVEGVREPGWDVAYVNSGDASMTDRLLDARGRVEGDGLICYGDTLANVDLRSLGEQHRQGGALMTLTVYPLRSPFGVVDLDAGGAITSFREKPVLPHWINVGFMHCSAGAWEFLRPGGDMPEFLDSLVAARQLRAFRHQGKHLTINTEKDRAQAVLHCPG